MLVNARLTCNCHKLGRGAADLQTVSITFRKFRPDWLNAFGELRLVVLLVATHNSFAVTCGVWL